MAQPPAPNETELIFNNYKKNVNLFNNYNNNKNIESLPYTVKQLNTIVTKEYILLIVWFIITLFVLIITILTILEENSLNKYAIGVIILFFGYIFFYFLNKIFKII